MDLSGRSTSSSFTEPEPIIESDEEAEEQVESVLPEEEGNASTTAALGNCQQGAGPEDVSEVVSLSTDHTAALLLLSEEMTALHAELATLHQTDEAHMMDLHHQVGSAVERIESQLAGLMCQYAGLAAQQAAQAALSEEQQQLLTAIQSQAQTESAAETPSLSTATSLVTQASSMCGALELGGQFGGKIAHMVAPGSASLVSGLSRLEAFGAVGEGLLKAAKSAGELLSLSSVVKDEMEQLREAKSQRKDIQAQLTASDQSLRETGQPLLTTQERAELEQRLTEIKGTIHTVRSEVSGKIFQMLMLIMQLIADFVQMVQGLLQLFLHRS